MEVVLVGLVTYEDVWVLKEGIGEDESKSLHVGKIVEESLSVINIKTLVASTASP